MAGTTAKAPIDISMDSATVKHLAGFAVAAGAVACMGMAMSEFLGVATVEFNTLRWTANAFAFLAAVIAGYQFFTNDPELDQHVHVTRDRPIGSTLEWVANAGYRGAWVHAFYGCAILLPISTELYQKGATWRNRPYPPAVCTVDVPCPALDAYVRWFVYMALLILWPVFGALVGIHDMPLLFHGLYHSDSARRWRAFYMSFPLLITSVPMILGLLEFLGVNALSVAGLSWLSLSIVIAFTLSVVFGPHAARLAVFQHTAFSAGYGALVFGLQRAVFNGMNPDLIRPLSGVVCVADMPCPAMDTLLRWYVVLVLMMLWPVLHMVASSHDDKDVPAVGGTASATPVKEAAHLLRAVANLPARVATTTFRA